MNRRSFLAMASITAATAFPATVWGVPSTRLDAATMKAALRTATPEEEGFVQYVIDRVEDGTLPADMVDSTFQWGGRKNFAAFSTSALG